MGHSKPAKQSQVPVDRTLENLAELKKFWKSGDFVPNLNEYDTRGSGGTVSGIVYTTGTVSPQSSSYLASSLLTK